MIHKKLAQSLLLLAATMLLWSCDDTLDDGRNAQVAPTINVVMPDDLADVEVESETFEVRNVTTGSVVKYSSRSDIQLRTGLYDVAYEAQVRCMVDGEQVEKHLTGYTPSVEITLADHTFTIEAYENIVNDDFVISEIFFTGTLRSTGNQYYGDDYVKLYNNTDHVLYADGITFLESKFVTTEKFDYSPDIMSDYMTVEALYTVPGSGHDYPVQPGEEFWIVDTGIDHRVANENSFDCSHADFEWYDVSTQPAHMDIDSPTVPNLDRWYSYTLSFFVLHNRGFRAWAIARIPVERDEFLTNYKYRYNYTMVLPAGTFPMSQTAYKVPNKWIVDAVNCSVESERVWNVTAPSLDRGWTYCGTMDHDKTRYFHSVRRKVLYLKDGKPVLKDTNNSSEDFNPFVTPSEIENQGTAMDVNGTPCTTLTWDGVMPRQK